MTHRVDRDPDGVTTDTPPLNAHGSESTPSRSAPVVFPHTTTNQSRVSVGRHHVARANQKPVQMPAYEGLRHQRRVPQVPHVGVEVIEHRPVGPAHHAAVELSDVFTQGQDPGGAATPLQFLGGRAVLMGQVIKPDEQPHLGLAEQALPPTEPPALGLGCPASHRGGARPGSLSLGVGLTRLVGPLPLPLSSLRLPLGRRRRRGAGDQGEHGQLGHRGGAAEGGGAVGGFAASRWSGGALLCSRALPPCKQRKT
ncbi:hypothetical protein EYF80_039312 [Liparis tanakae]|uniref:Uncharacterized protein n=1 Tax=Liparis tanakae TaxID=230148 RepID=A0A4Z2GCX2_9TELE|nr:hypothetical protein EYF80_039312 [Liparis tanakae]